MSIKSTRTASLTTWSRYPWTYAKIVRKIPRELWRGLTAKQLALVIDTMQVSYQEGECHRATEVLAEGGLWSEKRQRFVPLALSQK